MSRRKSNALFASLLVGSVLVSIETYVYLFKIYGFRAPLGYCLMSYTHCEWIVDYRYIIVLLTGISSFIVFAGKVQFKILRFLLALIIQFLVPLGLLIHMYFVNKSTWFELHGVLSTVLEVTLTYFFTIITTPYTYIYLLIHYLCTRWTRRFVQHRSS